MFSKIVHKKSWIYLILLPLLSTLPTTSWAYLCAFGTKNNFIQLGYTMAQVEEKCGAPDRVEVCQHNVADSASSKQTTAVLVNGGYTVTTDQNGPNTTKQVSQNINVTIWSYNQGPNLPELLFEFHNGRLNQAPLSITEDACTR